MITQPGRQIEFPEVDSQDGLGSLLKQMLQQIFNNFQLSPAEELLMERLGNTIQDPDILSILYGAEYHVDNSTNTLVTQIRPTDNILLLDLANRIVDKGYSAHRGEYQSNLPKHQLRPALSKNPAMDNMLVATFDTTSTETVDIENKVLAMLGIGIPNFRFFNDSWLEVDDLMCSDSGKTITQYIREHYNNRAIVASLGPLVTINPETQEIGMDNSRVFSGLISIFKTIEKLLKEADVTHVAMICRKGVAKSLNIFGFDLQPIEEFKLRWGNNSEGINNQEIFDSYPNYWTKNPQPQLYFAELAKLSEALHNLIGQVETQ